MKAIHNSNAEWDVESDSRNQSGGAINTLQSCSDACGERAA